MCSVPGHDGPEVWVFSRSGFHDLLATKPVSSETSKAERRSSGDPWFYLGLVAHSFFWFIREGLGSAVRLRARGTQRLTSRLRLALEPEGLANPTVTAREDSQHGADSIRDTQAVCGFR